MEDLLSNDRIIAHHRQKEDYEPSALNTIQFAYEDLRYVKMTVELFQADDILKLKTLEEINVDFHRGDFISLALLSSDLLAVLYGHLTNPHNEIRELSSSAMVLICSVQIGREKIMEKLYGKTIMKLFDDHVESIRHHAYQSLLNLSEFQQGIDHLLEISMITPLVDKLIEENVEFLLIEVLQLLLRTLAAEQGQVDVLRTPAIKRLTSLLERSNSKIRQLACQNLCSISFSEKGKIEIINLGCVLHIVACLKDEDELVIEQASMALSSLAQRNEAKFQIIDNNKLPLIFDLLLHPNEQIQLNIVHLITSLAEHPKGRQESKLCLEILSQFVDDPKYEYIAPYAEQAIEVILWIP